MNDRIKKPDEYKKYMDWMKRMCIQPGFTFDYNDVLNLYKKMIKDGIIEPAENRLLAIEDQKVGSIRDINVQRGIDK